MGRYIIKLIDKKDNNKPYYLEWSTVVDAPVTYGMSLDEFKEYYKEEYGNKGIEDLEQRMSRVESKGTSAYNELSAENVISYNRAGKQGGRLTYGQILEQYCRNKGNE